MNNLPTVRASDWLNKVPEVALSFWIIKIMSTTVGETGALSGGQRGLGQGVTRTSWRSVGSRLVHAVAYPPLHPWIYWLTVLVSVVGTQITDLLTDGLGVSLYISTSAFAVALAAIFLCLVSGRTHLSIHDIVTRSRELFYWAAILCTFALGTAAGDLRPRHWAGLYLGRVAFGALIGITYAAWRMGGNAVLTFWIGYILTRPFGAALGDLLTQAKTYGGLGMGAMWTSALFLSVIVMLVAVAQIGMNGRRSAQAAE
jgi:uncharacterized membrane-anchored protein